MSGMAGNVTAFNTVWTYDLYQTYLRPGLSDQHYLRMARAATVVGTGLSVATAYSVLRFDNLMDYVQLIGSFSISPLFPTFLLGMFWRRCNATGAFYGMIAEITGSAGHYLAVRYGLLHPLPPMATTFAGSILGWTVGAVTTVVVSLSGTPPRDDQLRGLARSSSGTAANPFSASLLGWAAANLVATAALNILCW